MENASKALIMAAGVLVAIIIIAVFNVMRGRINSFQMQQLSEEEQAQLITYNEQYTKYAGEYMYGTEIMTIINKHNDYFSQGFAFPLTVIINFNTPYKYNPITLDPTTGKMIKGAETSTTQLTLDANKSTFTETVAKEFRNRAFKCTSIGYDNNTGRVNMISFKEIET